MDLVRAFYRALNARDASSMAALYAASCRLEHVFDDEDYLEGAEAVSARWRREFTDSSAAPVKVTRICGIETGWGWVRADWIGAEPPTLGHTHFWIEDGRILRQRTVRDVVPAAAIVNPPSGRQFPGRPLVGVGAVILDDEGRVVLVKRTREPLAGQWSLPGGTLELGESLEHGVAREVLEETGLTVAVGPVVDVFDRILLDDRDAVRFHFVLVDYLCRVRSGHLAAGSDVSDATLADPRHLDPYRLAGKAEDVIRKAIAMAGCT
jgi:8-oxo-dGTP diphosphatase